MTKKIILALFVVVLAACASQQSKREAYLKNHPNTDPVIAQAIKAGKIRKGMTKEEVRASWGDPCWYCYGTKEASWGDSWEYNPFGTGRYSVGAGTYVYFDRSGKVINWSK